MRSGMYFLAWKEVFGNWKYLLTGITSAILFFVLNAIIVQWNNIGNTGFIGLITIGFYYAVPKITFYSTAFIALLTGILLSMIFYKFNMIRSGAQDKIGIIAASGILLGLLVPGCASCGIGLAAALGLGGSIASLPFHGIEISFFAIALLVISIFMMTRSFVECKIQIKKKR